ncbi:MAG: ATP-binding protein [Candidatus Delongbacteria bacterium]|nr:ATP-binding protein [Candidatus Delongbacteria bacterium]
MESKIQIITKRLNEKRRFIQVISGPRQVGKTTTVLEYLKRSGKSSLYITADDVNPENSVWISQQWEIVRLRMKVEKAGEYLLVIDEIQKIRNWSETVKLEWDKDSREKTNIKLVLLGSSQLLLQKGLTESLTGRFELIKMVHWSYAEMKKEFGLTPEQYVWFGAYPGAAELIHDETRFKHYVKNSIIETTISKDILHITRVDKPALLKSVCELGLLYSCQILSFNKFLGQLHDAGNTTTVSHYLELLDNSGIVGGISKFMVQDVRVRASSPKLITHNTALINAMMPETYAEIIEKPEKWGRMVESCVGSYLLNRSKLEEYKLFYWRDNNFEVDFVLKKGDAIVALEIKSGSRQKTEGMKKFMQIYGGAKSYIVGGQGLSWQEFLMINPGDLF